MFHRYTSLTHRFLLALLVFAFICVGQPKAIAQTRTRSLDLFAGVDFNFRDMNFNTQYEFLIRLTPSFKWNLGNHWQLAGQLYIPVLNQYGEQDKYIQPNILDLSKEFHIKNLYFKASAGIFSTYYYGVDLKAFLPITKWFAFEGQAGCVGGIIVNPFWNTGPMNNFVGTVGGDIYLTKWNTQFRCVVGKYLYKDFGGEVEAMRHFNHTTVSVYSRWNNAQGFDGGFRFVITIPPYHRKLRIVNFRPASNFRMSYTVMNHEFSNKMYRTDPEENERDGWFSRDFLQWGSHTMEPDFTIKN